jgi:hypothetical protein
MNKKVLLVIAIIVLVGSFTLAAAVPSVFDIGLINSYSIQSFMDKDFGAYSPGVRLSGYLCKWFGISAEVTAFAPFTHGLDSGEFLLEVGADGIFRYPFGLVEPYLAIGPAYRMVAEEDGFSFIEQVLLSARAGFDFNILPMLGVGIEARHFLDIPTLIHDPGLFEALALFNTRVALTVKAKF